MTQAGPDEQRHPLGSADAAAVTPRPATFIFACPVCGSGARSRVIDVDHDDDGHPVRVRRCAQGHKFSTEERIIGTGTSAFHGRAAWRLHNSVVQYRKKPGAVCRVCHGSFTRGWYYRRHVNTPQHLGAISDEVVRNRKAARDGARRRYWMKRYGMAPPPRNLSALRETA